MYYHEKLDQINAKLESIDVKEKIVVWPCGIHTSEMLNRTILPRYLVNIEFADQTRKGQEYMGKIIKSPQDIKWAEVGKVIVSSLKYQESIISELIEEINFNGKIISFYRDDSREFYRLYDVFHGISWGETYERWEDAEAVCAEGYAEKSILDACSESTKKVKQGICSPDYFFAAHILAGYIKYGSLVIIDYGGALGGEYFNNRKFLDELCVDYKWCVVEQAHIVIDGKQNYESGRLRFFFDLEEVIEEYGHSNYIIYMRGSLQYIKNSYELLESFGKLQAKVIIIDKTPMSEQERIVIQRVRDYIYEAALPARIFDRNKLIEQLEKQNYWLDESEKRMDMQFSDLDACYERLVFKRKEIAKCI